MLKKIGFLIFNIVFFSVIVVMIWQTISMYNTKKEVLSEIKKIEEEYKEYEEKKKKVELNIKNFSEEEKIERIARDKLNLKKDGETTYKIIN